MTTNTTTTTTTTTTTKSTAAGAVAATSQHGGGNGGCGRTVTTVDATIKQSGHDKMRHRARYNDEARRDSKMRRHDDAATTRRTARDET